MTGMTRAGTVWMLGGLLLTLTSCGLGIDETYTSMGQNAAAGTHLNPICDDCGGSCQIIGGTQTQDVTQINKDIEFNIDVDDLTGKIYRFDTLVLGAPFDPDGTIGVELNKAVAEQIGLKALNVMMEATSDDRTTGDLVFAVGPGTFADPNYAVDSSNDFLCGLADVGFYTKEPGELDLVISLFTDGPGSDEPGALFLKKVSLSGEFNSDATEIQSGYLEAVLTIEDAKEVYFMGMSLEDWFLSMDDVEPNADIDDDGEKDAYRFTGTFTARPATIQ